MCNKLKLFIANDNEYSQQFYDNINKLHDYCTDKIIRGFTVYIMQNFHKCTQYSSSTTMDIDFN